MTTVILADFENFEDYKAIKGSQAFATLALHRESLLGAKVELEAQGYEVLFEMCDREGYEEFLKVCGAVNSPQSVAAYVVMKHGKVEHIPRPELQHINVTIHRDKE